MPDLDTELRRLANSLVEPAPQAPSFDEIVLSDLVTPVDTRRALASGWLVAVVVVVVIVSSLGVFALSRGGEDRVVAPVSGSAVGGDCNAGLPDGDLVAYMTIGATQEQIDVARSLLAGIDGAVIVAERSNEEEFTTLQCLFADRPDMIFPGITAADLSYGFVIQAPDPAVIRSSLASAPGVETVVNWPAVLHWPAPNQGCGTVGDADLRAYLSPSATEPEIDVARSAAAMIPSVTDVTVVSAQDAFAHFQCLHAGNDSLADVTLDLIPPSLLVTTSGRVDEVEVEIEAMPGIDLVAAN